MQGSHFVTESLSIGNLEEAGKGRDAIYHPHTLHYNDSFLTSKGVISLLLPVKKNLEKEVTAAGTKINELDGSVNMKPYWPQELPEPSGTSKLHTPKYYSHSHTTWG